MSTRDGEYGGPYLRTFAVDLKGAGSFFNALAHESLNRLGAAFLLVILAPLLVVVAIVIRLESRGPAFFRCRRIGRRGQEFGMLKFRKMHASASGSVLTSPNDPRFTRLGPFLATSKLDELPQLWNVVRGQMSLVGPRPEDASFVQLEPEAYDVIAGVKPGMTGLSQLAFARESDILDSNDRVTDYVERLLPAKILLDQLYAEHRSIRVDLRILFWTIVAVGLRCEIAVDRDSVRLNLRRRPKAGAVQSAERP